MKLSVLSRAWQAALNLMKCKCTESDHHHETIFPQSSTLAEFISATNNFSPQMLVNEDSGVRIYRGVLQPNNQLVAIKQFHMDLNKKHFLSEVMILSHIHHENIINLRGYCSAESHRLIVLENAALRPLSHLLFRPSDFIIASFDASSSKPLLDWSARIRIALGVARGLEYLHHTMCPPVILRDLNTSNIMLGDDLTPKISNFELAKFDRKHAISKIDGTLWFIAPEHLKSGQVSTSLDIYSFGIVLLELITGIRVCDIYQLEELVELDELEERDLSSWARELAEDAKKSMEMVDPRLNGELIQMEDLSKMMAIAAMCIEEESEHRPLAADLVAMLSSMLLTSDDPEED